MWGWEQSQLWHQAGDPGALGPRIVQSISPQRGPRAQVALAGLCLDLPSRQWKRDSPPRDSG